MSWLSILQRPTPDPDEDVALLTDALLLVLDRWEEDHPPHAKRIAGVRKRLERLPVPSGLLRELKAVAPPKAPERTADTPRTPQGVTPELVAEAARTLAKAMRTTALFDHDIKRLIQDFETTLRPRLGAGDTRALIQRAQELARSAKPARRRAEETQSEVNRLLGDLTQELQQAGELGGTMDNNLKDLTQALNDPDVEDLKALRASLVTHMRKLTKDTGSLRKQLKAAQKRAKSLEDVVATQAARIINLRSQANLDELTGVANRRAYEEWIAQEVPRCAEAKIPLALVLLDVDHFKQVNDTHGHATGDDVLKELGKRLMQGVRAHDEVARVGGEEFAIILRNAPPHVAVEVAERLRQRGGFTHQTEAGPCEVRLSAGIAILGEEDDPRSLFERADRALYRAKEGGRDQLMADTSGAAEP